MDEVTDNKPPYVQIDVEKILESKAPSLKKRLPGFVISYLKRIVHQEEVNYIFSQIGHLQGIAFADALMEDYFHVTTELKGVEKLPSNGRVIFACNHPLGSIDGIAIIQTLARKYGQLKAPVNDLLMHIENLSEFFIPINKIQGKGQSRTSTALMNEALESDMPILFFPAGQCSRRQLDGSIRDNEWKKTFIAKAKEHKRDIIPLHFDGKNSNFFYNLAYYRQKLGIKANIEMLYLADEFFKQKYSHYTLTVGDPIPYISLDNSKSDKEWAEEVKSITYALTSLK